jgi:YesN/AraC family two-component response regulator
MQTKRFAIAHLYNEEKPMAMHIHDCYEIYYSVSGGKRFLIDNKYYDINAGDIFVINQYESHYLDQIDSMVHERIILSIHADYLKQLSTPKTNLDYCFTHRTTDFSHRIILSKEQQQRFIYYIHKISSLSGFGSDVLEQATFAELLVMINSQFQASCDLEESKGNYQYNSQVATILEYINKNISNEITIKALADNFYLSESYICRIFKAETGTTINKYLTARRISIAKSLLDVGLSVTEVCEKSGFHDYSNFLKAFTKAVGISPKKYSQYSSS